MDRNSLFEEVNRRRQSQLLAPLSKEDYIAALSSLEIQGVIESRGNEIVPKNNVKGETKWKL